MPEFIALLFRWYCLCCYCSQENIFFISNACAAYFTAQSSMYCLNQNQFYANDSVHSSLTCSLTSNGATTNESGEEWFMRQNMQSFGHSPHGNIINYPLLSIEEEAFWQYSPPSHSSPIGHQPSIQSIPTLLQQQAPFQPQYMYQQPFVPPPVQYQQPPSHHHCDLELLSRMQMAKNSTDDIYEVFCQFLRSNTHNLTCLLHKLYRFLSRDIRRNSYLESKCTLQLKSATL